MKKPAIGFDLDDTIIDHVPNRQRLAAQFGLSLSDEQLYDLSRQSGIPKTLIRSYKQELYGPLSLSAPIMPGARDGLEKLAQQFRPVIISRRYSVEEAKQWVQENLGDLFNPTDIYFVTENHEKAPLAEQHELVAFVDDNPVVLDHMPASIMTIQMLRFPALEPNKHIQVESWPEVLEHLL